MKERTGSVSMPAAPSYRDMIANRKSVAQRWCNRIVQSLMVIGLSLSVAHAEQRELKGVDTKEEVDAVLVLDASGSMRLTDPGRLRDEGANLFIQFLKQGDRFSVVEFSESAREHIPMTSVSEESLASVGQKIKSVGNEGKFTDILQGLQKAASILISQGRPDAKKTIVLLSDGKMDPDPKLASIEARTQELKNTLLPDLKSKGIRIHSLAFSEEADQELLREIAISTDGVFHFAPDAETIHEAFAELFIAVKKPQILPLKSKGFRVDPDIDEATFYINRAGQEKVEVIQPDGSRFDESVSKPGIKWFHGKKFDVVTIDQPMDGNWEIVGLPKNDGFATVLTRLKLLTDWPTTVSSGEKVILQARLYEDDKPVVLPQMTDVTRYAYQVTPTDKVSEPIITELLHDDGERGDKIARDGIYSSEVEIESPGEYKLRVVATNPTFERYQQIPFRVKPRLVSLQVVSVEDEHAHTAAGEHAPTIDYFRVYLSPEVKTLKNVEVDLVAVDEDRKRYEIPVKKAGDNLRFEAPAKYLPHDGKYEMQAFLTGLGKRRKRVRSASRSLEYHKSTAHLEHEEDDVVVVHEIGEEGEKEKEKPVEEEGFPILYLVLLTVINAAAGGFGMVTLKKSQSSSSVEDVQINSTDEAETLVGELEARAAESEVDVNDPRFSPENMTEQVQRAASAGTSSDAETGESEPAEEQETAEAEEESAAAEEADNEEAEDDGDTEGSAEDEVDSEEDEDEEEEKE